MSTARTFGFQALVALLLVALTIPGEVLRPDPAAVSAAALRGPEVILPSAPATPGTYRSANSAANTAIVGIDIAKPAGLTTNDVMIAAITVRAAPVVTAPSGWTLVRSDASGTALSQHVYRKVATGSEPATYSWTFDAPVAAAVGGISAYAVELTRFGGHPTVGAIEPRTGSPDAEPQATVPARVPG